MISWIFLCFMLLLVRYLLFALIFTEGWLTPHEADWSVRSQFCSCCSGTLADNKLLCSPEMGEISANSTVVCPQTFCTLHLLGWLLPRLGTRQIHLAPRIEEP